MSLNGSILEQHRTVGMAAKRDTIPVWKAARREIPPQAESPYTDDASDEKPWQTF